MNNRYIFRGKRKDNGAWGVNMVNTQREIHFINDCNAIVDYKELESAIFK